MGLSVKGSKDPMTQISALKFVEEVIVKIMQANKVVELFQTMVIVSSNMGNLTLEVNNLNYRLVIGEANAVL
jgi:hypothetical protein